MVDWPLRLWHWLFAAAIATSLYTGLIGDLSLIDWHMRSGYLILGLLLFRLGWGLWGASYARFGAYRFRLADLWHDFRRQGPSPSAHTAPGTMLAGLMLLAAAAQAASGLFTTDDIFTDGPLVRHASDAVVGAMSTGHHRIFWVLIGAVSLHLTAHLVYALRRNPMPLAMISGRKPLRLAATRSYPWRALATAAASFALIWTALTALAG
jgi:cytochrome b